MKKPPYPGKRLTTLHEVDEALAQAATARNESENNFLDELRSFWLDLTPPGGDPWSEEYRNHWKLAYEFLGLYAVLCGN